VKGFTLPLTRNSSYPARDQCRDAQPRSHPAPCGIAGSKRSAVNGWLCWS